MIEQIKALDRKLSSFIHNLSSDKKQFNKALLLLTNLFGIPLILILAALLSGNIYLLLIIAIVSLSVNFVIVQNFAKSLIIKNDPSVTEVNKSSYTAPSAHSSTVFTFITFVTHLNILGSRLSNLLILLAFGGFIALSRVYLGKHYLLDIIFGIAIGIGIALIISELISLGGIGVLK